MKAYDEEKCLLGVLAVDDFGMTRGQDQSTNCSLFKPL